MRSEGRLGLIVPVSIAAAEAFAPLRAVIWQRKPLAWFSHFANRPGQLFTGGQNRLSIVLITSNQGTPRLLSTRYHRWKNAKKGEREYLFAKLAYSDVTPLFECLDKTVPKIGSHIGLSITDKLLKNRPLIHGLVKSSEFPVFWVRVPGYFCQFYLRQPMARPENGGPERPRGELLTIYAGNKYDQHALHAVLNSSTFYTYFCITTDGRHINPSDVKLFPFDLTACANLRPSFEQASRRIEESFGKYTTRVRKSGLLIDSVQVEKTKTDLDLVDAILGTHYRFTAEELDYISHYDVKYRLGGNLEDGE